MGNTFDIFYEMMLIFDFGKLLKEFRNGKLQFPKITEFVNEALRYLEVFGISLLYKGGKNETSETEVDQNGASPGEQKW